MSIEIRVLEDDLLNYEGICISSCSDSIINKKAEKMTMGGDSYKLNQLSLTEFQGKAGFVEAFVEHAIFRGNESFRIFKKRKI